MTDNLFTDLRGGSEECLQGLKPISFSALMSELKLRPPKDLAHETFAGGIYPNGEF
jgi:hypothetical protein